MMKQHRHADVYKHRRTHKKKQWILILDIKFKVDKEYAETPLENTKSTVCICII